MSKQIDREIAKLLGVTFVDPTHGPCCTCQNCGRPNDECWGCRYSTRRDDALEAFFQLIGDDDRLHWEFGKSSNQFFAKSTISTAMRGTNQ